MKRNMLILIMTFSLVFLVGCSNKDEIEELKRQNLLLQQQLEQQNTLLEYQLEQQTLENEKKEQERLDKINFENNIKCQERWDELKKQYNNFHSAYYHEYENRCYVRYYEKNILKDAPMDEVWVVKLETPLMNWSYEIKHGINFRMTPWTSWRIIQKIDPTNIVDIIDYTYVDGELWYYINMYGTRWWISSVAF